MATVGGIGRPGVERSRGRWDLAPTFGRVAAGVGVFLMKCESIRIMDRLSTKLRRTVRLAADTQWASMQSGSRSTRSVR